MFANRISQNAVRTTKTAVFTRFNTTFSNTTSTVNSVNSIKSRTESTQVQAKSILGVLGSNIGKPTSGSNFYANKRTFTPLITNEEPDPYDYATRFILSDKLAGRSTTVANRDLDRAISQFDSLVKSNRLREVSYDQRFFTKPNKKRLAKRVANRKRVFESGIAKLFDVVKDAVRKGY